MARFEEFLNTRAQERVRAADREGCQLRVQVEFEVVPASVAVHLETAESVDGHLAEKVRDVLEVLARRRTGKSELADGFETSLSGVDCGSVVAELRSVAKPRIHDMDTSRASVELARDRQVVVFTHDASFALDVRNEATRSDVAFQGRCVQRVAGGCRHMFERACLESQGRQSPPEGSRGAPRTFREETRNWDEDGYDKEVADFAGKLSEPWERLVRLDIANELVDPVELEVRPAKLRLLAKVTETDVEEFRQSYGRCSRWARRHDKDPGLNRVAPSVEKLRAEPEAAQERESGSI